MRRNRLSAEAYVRGILSNDRIILSQAITLVESMHPSDRQLAGDVLQQLMPHTGKAYRLGITGVPGVGKSTFIDAFGSYLLDQNLTVAVLAIDPSSQRSQGSILGDKTRMNRLSHAQNAYVRPSPTGGSLGGVARKTRETLLLCEAAGFDVIVIETVGVGQSEIAVHSMVDFFLLLMLPNAGDELQGIKKGIMEMADAVVINKADGPQMTLARQARVQYQQALRLFSLGEAGWRPEVAQCSAIEDKGMDTVWDMLTRYRTHTEDNGYWHTRRSRQALQWMEDTIAHELKQAFYRDDQVAQRLERLRGEVAEGKVSPTRVAEELVQGWRRSGE